MVLKYTTFSNHIILYSFPQTFSPFKVSLPMMIVFWTKMCHDISFAFLGTIFWIPMSTTYDWFHAAADGMFYTFVTFDKMNCFDLYFEVALWSGFGCYFTARKLANCTPDWISRNFGPVTFFSISIDRS